MAQRGACSRHPFKAYLSHLQRIALQNGPICTMCRASVPGSAVAANSERSPLQERNHECVQAIKQPSVAATLPRGK